MTWHNPMILDLSRVSSMKRSTRLYRFGIAACSVLYAAGFLVLLALILQAFGWPTMLNALIDWAIWFQNGQGEWLTCSPEWAA